MTMRRAVLIALGTAVLGVPVRSVSQQPRTWRVGFIGPGYITDCTGMDYCNEFSRAMARLGYVEGRNLSIEVRNAQGRYERLHALAADLVDRKVDVIVTRSTPATRAAKQATAAIPIVMSLVGDPVGNGF